MLQVKLLDPRAKAPTVAHPGEDLAYDLYALEDVTLEPGNVAKVKTGVAVSARSAWDDRPHGLLIRDRSSMASRGVFTHGGVIDAGYRGEIVVLMSTLQEAFYITTRDKIAQMIPVQVLTGEVIVTDELPEANRGDKGFGSSGR